MANFRTLTVKQLIELLEGESPDQRVIFSADYGDYHHTEQALPIRGELDTVTIGKSAYSNSGFSITEPDEDDNPSEDAETFLVIR